MSFSDVIVSAVVSAVVALFAAMATYIVNSRTLAAERLKFEKQLQRGLTEKLYNLRLESYPKAWEITEGLRYTKLWKDGEAPSEQYLTEILASIDSWHSSKAAFLLSDPALDNLYALHDALRVKPELEGKYSEAQIRRIWEAKNKFRASLRNDIFLLYREELGQSLT